MIQLMGDDGLWVFDGTVIEMFGMHGNNHRWHAVFIETCQIEARQKDMIALKIRVGSGGTTILMPASQMEGAKQFVDAVLAARDRFRSGG